VLVLININIAHCTPYKTAICQSYLSLVNDVYRCRYRSKSVLSLRMVFTNRPGNCIRELRKNVKISRPRQGFMSVSCSRSAQQPWQIRLIWCLCEAYVHKTFSTDQEHTFQRHLLYWLLYQRHVDPFQAFRSAWYLYITRITKRDSTVIDKLIKRWNHVQSCMYY
jgi:hypothetical protein